MWKTKRHLIKTLLWRRQQQHRWSFTDDTTALINRQVVLMVVGASAMTYWTIATGKHDIQQQNRNCTIVSTRMTRCEPSPSSSIAVVDDSTVYSVAAALLRRQQTMRKMQNAAERKSLEEKYDVEWTNPLGEGSFGTVYAATERRSGERVAVKKICKTLTDNATFHREMEALLHLRQTGGHPNICGLRENFNEDGYYYLVLDLIEGGCELFDALIQHGAYSEAEAARLVQQTASALDYLHGIQIVHGDLKPENLMLSSQQYGVADYSAIKVVDFGCAQVSHDDDVVDYADDDDTSTPSKSLKNGSINETPTSLPTCDTGIARTPAYCPPEVLEARLLIGHDDSVIDNRVEPSLDMWALGVILYVMLTGVHPFDICGNASNEEIEQQIILRKMPPLWNSSITAHLSDDSIALIEQLLQWDATKRLTAHQVLENPWVRGETASTDKMANSDKRLSKYRMYKTKLEARVFANMVLLAPRTDDRPCSSRKQEHRLSDNRTSLIEHAFRRLDHGRKGYVTAADIHQLTQEPQITAPAVEVSQKPGDEEQLSLGSFADLMSETMKNRYFPKGHLIYHEGDIGESMFFLNSGAVEVFTSDGFSKALRTPGDYFGEGALVDPRKIRSASIRCLTAVHVIEVNRKYFEKYMAEDFDLKANLREVHKSRKRQRANAFFQLQQSSEERVFQRGEFIFKKGEPGNELFILEEGQVDTDVDGHKVFSVDKRGDIVGESSIVFQRPRNVSAQCHSEQCTLHVLRSDDFDKISQSHPSMQESIREMCLRREFQKGVCVQSQKPFPETEDDLRLAFDAVDIDKSGKLELRNVRNLIERLDSRFTEDEIREILVSLDLDENGAVTWKEFKLIFGIDSGGG